MDELEEAEELVEIPEELMSVVTEEDAELVEKTVDDAVLKDEDVVRTESMLDVVPRVLVDDARDDDDEVLVEDTEVVGLTELPEIEELPTTEELLEIEELPELLLELGPLLLELTELLVESDVLSENELLEPVELAELLEELVEEESELEVEPRTELLELELRVEDGDPAELIVEETALLVELGTVPVL